MDHGGCGLLLEVEDGRIVRVKGDPDCSLNRGTVCAKGIAQIERLNHPDRLRYPLRGLGPRRRAVGEDSVGRGPLAPRREIRGENRPGEEKSIAFAQGTPKGLELYLMIRLANILKVPHVVTPGSICHMPRETASLITCGFFPVPDYDHPPALVLAWGSNLFQTNEEGVIGSQLRRALDRGARMVTQIPGKRRWPPNPCSGSGLSRGAISLWP